MEEPDLAMQDETSQQLKKRKKDKASKSHVLSTTTIKSPPWTYMNLELISSASLLAPRTKLDELTVRSYLNAALTQFLGMTGSAISIDILKIEEGGRECWVRVPRDEASAFMAAVGGWVGIGDRGGDEDESVSWRIRGSGGWLSAVLGRREGEKIWD